MDKEPTLLAITCVIIGTGLMGLCVNHPERILLLVPGLTIAGFGVWLLRRWCWR